MNRWAGPLITTLILGTVVVFLLMNLNLGTSPGQPTPVKPGPGPTPKQPPSPTATVPAANPAKGNFREYPIGDEVEKNGMRVAAVWLPPIQMDGRGTGGSDVIHLEADVKATEGNPHGFALGEFVPYLKIAYEIAPADGGGGVQKGDLMPMVAADGLHYGASVAMPRSGAYRLTYRIEPPSAGGLGRHSDALTGVAPWWAPFDVAFDWDYPGPPAPAR